MITTSAPARPPSRTTASMTVAALAAGIVASLLPVVFGAAFLVSVVIHRPLVAMLARRWPSLSGGPLEFDAYLLWAPKIVPREHQGSLIRIRGASGTLFDPTFMRYQVAELTRLRQITCEIFVRNCLFWSVTAARADRQNRLPAQPSVAIQTNFVILFIGVPLQMRQCRELRTVRSVRGRFAV